MRRLDHRSQLRMVLNRFVLPCLLAALLLPGGAWALTWLGLGDEPDAVSREFTVFLKPAAPSVPAAYSRELTVFCVNPYINVLGAFSRELTVFVLSETVTGNVGVSNRGAADLITRVAGQNFRFTVWGRVTATTTDTLTLDDGSGSPVKVDAPGYSGVGLGDYGVATGVLLNTPDAPVTLVSSAAAVRKIPEP